MSGGWSAPAYAEVAEILRARTGLVFGPHRFSDAETGIRRALDRLPRSEELERLPRSEERQPDRLLAGYPDLLERRPAALDELIDELTVNETHFFRHPAQLEFFEQVALPELRARRGPDHVMRAWSAGCSTGEEAYTIAILLQREPQCPNAPQQHSFVLGSDVSRRALGRAREAIYRRWSLRGVGDEAIARYFRPIGARFQLVPSVQRQVRFEHLNLALDAYPSFGTGAWGMDVIFCRNVLIYLDRPAIRVIGRRLFDTLAEGGWLFLGPSDPRLDEAAPYEVVATPAGLFYRRGAAPRVVAPTHAPAPEPARIPTVEPEPPVASAPPEDRARVVIAEARRLAALGDVEGALRVAEGAGSLSVELYFLRAVLLLSIERTDAAIAELRRALFLDPTLAVAHFVLGAALTRQGSFVAAQRSYRNARDLAVARPPDELIAFGDGEQAARFAAVAQNELTALDERARTPR